MMLHRCGNKGLCALHQSLTVKHACPAACRCQKPGKPLACLLSTGTALQPKPTLFYEPCGRMGRGRQARTQCQAGKLLVEHESFRKISFLKTQEHGSSMFAPLHCSLAKPPSNLVVPSTTIHFLSRELVLGGSAGYGDCRSGREGGKGELRDPGFQKVLKERVGGFRSLL